MGNDRAIVLVVKMQEFRRDGDWLRVDLPVLDVQVVQEEVNVHASSRQVQDVFSSDIVGVLRAVAR